MSTFGQIIWTTRNKTFHTSLINNFQTFWEQSAYQSSNDLIILLWTTKMGVTFKWYELVNLVNY